MISISPPAIAPKTRRAGVGRLSPSIVLCGALACTGTIEAGKSGREPMQHEGTLAGTSGGAGAGGSRGGTLGPTGTGGSAGVDPGSKTLHRLNTNEYNNTVADVLGTKLQPATSSWLGGEVNGFDNIASVLSIDEAQFQRYFDAAILIADDVFASPVLRDRVVTCQTESPSCVESIIRATGRRLFRRPLRDDEVTTFSKVYAAARALGDDHPNSVKLVVQAFLSSVEFLYRIEVDPTPDSPDKHLLNPYELASRLSYFLWSSAPDDMLLAAAEDGSLNQEQVLRASVDRMLADPLKGNRFVVNFSGQWLGARKLPFHAADMKTFPDWSSELATSLTREMYSYFGEFLKTDRSWLDFMKADINFIDASNAKFYGVPAAPGPAQKVEVKDDKRFGFAGLAGFLALSSLPERTSPTLRGRWVLANLLCVQPPTPPPGVPELGVGSFDPAKNVGLALAEHRKNPTCKACHGLFDPYGLSLEHFDGIGKYREVYGDGAPINATVDLQGQMFSGLEGLADTVTKDPRFSECITQFLFVYGLGRQTTANDAPYLKKVQEDWMKGTPSIRRLLQSLVVSDTFRSRHAPAM